MNKKQIQKLGVVAILFLTFFDAVAQDKYTLPKREFRVSLETIFYQKLSETSNDGNTLFNSRDVPSGMLSISNNFRLPHHFSLEPNIGISLIPYNYHFNFDLPNDHPLKVDNDFDDVDGNGYDFSLYTAKLGCFISREFALPKNREFYFSLGVNLNIYPTYSLGFGESYQLKNQPPDSTFRLFSMHLEDDLGVSAYWWGNFSYTSKFGFTKYNNKGNGYGIGLIFNYQPDPIGIGEYYFNMGDRKVSGNLKWKNSYYGLIFTKTFNRTKQAHI